MTTDSQNEKTVTFDGKNYKFSELSNEQLTYVYHCADLENKISSVKFQLQQLQVSHSAFANLLRNSLSLSETSDESGNKISTNNQKN